MGRKEWQKAHTKWNERAGSGLGELCGQEHRQGDLAGGFGGEGRGAGLQCGMRRVSRPV